VSDHLARARAARDRLRAELEAARAWSSDDEQAFARKERRRLAKDLARLAPVVLAAPPPGPKGAAAVAAAGGAPAAAPRGLGPGLPPARAASMATASSLASLPSLGAADQQRQHQQQQQQQQQQPRFVPPSEGFASIGGLGDVKRALREMALLPLSQPELLRQLGIVAPR
jgi:SpoVK/Ycf46/Vps4 family AAA+-type ATPase